jgi:hypothetical protein
LQLPRARGPLSAAVVERLGGSRPRLDPDAIDSLPDDVLRDDDFQLALWVLYELHYRGFEDAAEDAADDLEWAPDVLAFRRALEERFESALRALVPAIDRGDRPFVDRLLEVIESGEGPSVATYVQREATKDQVRELMQQRSVYHLKESDPQSWAIPRVDDGTKAALVELQYDEYGAGRADRVHATLFANLLAALDLDSSYGAHLDRAPGYALAENNMMSLFGLHRRLRGASMGHLAAFESTSSLPCRRYAQGIRRLALPDAVAEYYDEHVEADAVHEQVAVRDVCGRLVAAAPELEDDVLFGAAAYVKVEELVATSILEAWSRGESCLRPEQMGAVA